MAVRSKTGTAPLQHLPGKPKLTRQGNGKRSSFGIMGANYYAAKARASAVQYAPAS
jgi:hypothetical protein